MDKCDSTTLPLLYLCLSFFPSYLEQIFKLVDAEAELSHGGFEQLSEAILLHQTHKHTERLLLRHLGKIRWVSQY